MALFLTEADVQELLTPADAVAAVELAMRESGAGTAFNLPRQRLRLPNGMLHMMAAAQPLQGYFALKAYTAFGGKVRFRVLLYDAKTGDIVALIEGDRMGQLRTGAASAVAAKFMAADGIETAGLFGTGFQAEGQLETMVHARPLKRVTIYGRQEERKLAFCKKMSDRLQIDVVPAAKPEDAVRDMPLVTTATTSKEPVFDGNWLTPGTLVNAVGANLLIKREIDGTVLRKSKIKIVDSREVAALESGALLQALESGHLHWEQIHELADVVSGRVSGRGAPEDISLFHSLGMALWDSAVAIHVYRRALELKRGKELPFS
jgi:ornithine cyclodeaminase/alanine dehydrogenase-like protein (mu-crystallin family)